MNIFDTLNARGYVYQSKNLERIKTKHYSENLIGL